MRPIAILIKRVLADYEQLPILHRPGKTKLLRAKKKQSSRSTQRSQAGKKKGQKRHPLL